MRRTDKGPLNGGRDPGADAALLRPEHARALAKHVAGLNALLREVREYIPGANYYLAMDDLNLMSGESHGPTGVWARQDRVMASAHMPHSSGGDW